MHARTHVLSLVTAFLFACSGSTTGTGDGTGGLFGGNGNADGGAASTNAPAQGDKVVPPAQTPAPQQGATCQLQHATIGTSACDQCLAKNCCAQMQGCDGNAECVALVSCVEACNGDHTCNQSCAQQHPDGAQAFVTWGQCIQNDCSASCQ